MATFREILEYLAQPRTRDEIAYHFWPNSTRYAAHGGPSGNQWAASAIINKLRYRGLVNYGFDPERPHTDCWKRTPLGKEFCQKEASP